MLPAEKTFQKGSQIPERQVSGGLQRQGKQSRRKEEGECVCGGGALCNMQTGRSQPSLTPSSGGCSPWDDAPHGTWRRLVLSLSQVGPAGARSTTPIPRKEGTPHWSHRTQQLLFGFPVPGMNSAPWLQFVVLLR